MVSHYVCMRPLLLWVYEVFQVYAQCTQSPTPLWPVIQLWSQLVWVSWHLYSQVLGSVTPFFSRLIKPFYIEPPKWLFSPAIVETNGAQLFLFTRFHYTKHNIHTKGVTPSMYVLSPRPWSIIMSQPSTDYFLTQQISHKDFSFYLKGSKITHLSPLLFAVILTCTSSVIFPCWMHNSFPVLGHIYSSLF